MCLVSAKSYFKIQDDILKHGILKSISLYLSGPGVPHLRASDFLSVCCCHPGKGTLDEKIEMRKCGAKSHGGKV